MQTFNKNDHIDMITKRGGKAYCFVRTFVSFFNLTNQGGITWLHGIQC